MRNIIFTLCLVVSFSSSAQKKQYYLGKDEQPYFKNDPNGQNDLDRIDNNVREINRMHGELASLKQQMAAMEERLKVLEAAKK